MSENVNAWQRALFDIRYTTQGKLFIPDHFYLLKQFLAMRETNMLTEQEKTCVLEPMISILESIGQDGLDKLLSNVKKTSEAKYFSELAEALLQRNYSNYRSAYKDLLAFQAIVNILHYEMLNSKIGDVVQRTLYPLASWGSTGPFTYYYMKNLDVELFKQIAMNPVTVVKLPAVFRNGGIAAWASISHEIGGHGFLRSIPHLLKELKARLRDSMESEFKGEGDAKIVDYWVACTEELASDVLGILNLGPSFGIGLALYMKGKAEDQKMQTKGILHSEQVPPSRDVELNSEAFPQSKILIRDLNKDVQIPNSGYFGRIKQKEGSAIVDCKKLFVPGDKHPLDIFRIFAVMGLVELLNIEEQSKRAFIDFFNELIADELSNLSEILLKEILMSKEGLELAPNPYAISIEKAKLAAKVAACTIAQVKLSTINETKLIDLLSWDMVDEDIVTDITLQFANDTKKLTRPRFTAAKKLIGRHILAASILEAVKGEYNIEMIFVCMKHWLRNEAKKTTPNERLFYSESASESVESDATSEQTTEELTPDQILARSEADQE